MKTRESIVTALRGIKPELKQRYGLRSLALFGSYARGDQSAASDVDILVDVDPGIGLRFVDLADEIERAIGEPVDVVSRRGVKPRYFDQIERDLVHV